METINCEICSSEEFEKFISVKDRFDEEAKIDYNIVKCNCGFYFLNPRPNAGEISQFYQNADYDPHKKKESSLFDKIYLGVQRFALNQKFNRINKFIKSGTLLDIGGGIGEFAEYMNNNNFKATLQDNHSNYKGELTFYNDLNTVKSNFDIITMWHVLEHIHDVNYTLSWVENHLNNSGYFVLAIPNHNAIERQFYQKDWAPYDAPRHLYHFDIFSLNKLLKKHDFEIVKKYTLIQDTFYNILLSIKKFNIISILQALIVLPVCILKSIIYGTNYSSSIMVICRKK